MTVPSSGAISLTDLQDTFGGPTPVALGNYYAGGGHVPNPPPTSPFQIGGPIPTSGEISLLMFLGTETVFVFNDVVTSNRAGGYDLAASALAAGWNGASKLQATVTINSGVILTGGFYTGSGFPAGSSLTLYNYGILVGAGGSGGHSGSIAGGGGGTALTADYPIRVRNNGWIAGGGGGGSGGQSADGWKASAGYQSYGGGGGGGGGAGRGPGGSGGEYSPQIFDYPDGVQDGTSGANGDWLYGGAGGAGAGVSAGQAGNGGRGGHLAGFGWTGGLASSGGWIPVAAGGAPGAAIIGGANITWIYNTGILGGYVDNFGTANLGTFEGGNPVEMGNSYKNVIYSYPRNNPMSDTVWWPTSSDGQGFVTYTFATLVTNSTIYPMSVRLRGSIDDAVTGIRVNGASAIVGNTLGFGNVSFSPSFNLQPGINLVEILCSNLYNNSPAWMCIELQKTSTGEVLVPTWAWRQA